jgi:hypothetical protein
VGVAELRRRLDPQAVPRAVVLDGLEISTWRVPDGGEIDVDVQLAPISNGLSSRARSPPWQGDCRRCLDPVEGPVERR